MPRALQKQALAKISGRSGFPGPGLEGERRTLSDTISAKHATIGRMHRRDLDSSVVRNRITTGTQTDEQQGLPPPRGPTEQAISICFSTHPLRLHTMKSLTDRPITSDRHDLFGRATLARTIADHLLSFPPDTSHRFGIYGEWGSGKTSVLELVDQYLKDQDHVTVWLLPWALGSTEEVLSRLLSDLAEELKIGQKRRWKLLRAAELGASATKIGEGLDLTMTLAMRAARPILDKAANSIKLRHGQELLTEIGKRLGKKRAVVIIDDLDRTTPAAIPDILLMIREAMSLPSVHYLLALSPNIVKKGLVEAHPGWSEDPQDFLDKIIEYPILLPSLTNTDIKRATRSIIGSDSKFPPPKVILEIGEYLPQNPRQLKLFLRFVRSISDIFDRYSEDELDLQGALLVQMLRLEFLEESLILIADDKVVESIDRGTSIRRLEERMHKKEKLEDETPETNLAPKCPQSRRERFLQLCQAVRERDLFMTEYKLRDLYHLVDRPPVITWKEFNLLVDGKKNEELVFQDILGRLMGSAGAHDRETRIHAIWSLLIRGREAAWNKAIDADERATIRERLEVLPIIDSIIREIGVGRGFFNEGILGSSHWMSFWKGVIDWDRFVNVPEYPPLRESERSLAFDLAMEMTDEHKSYTWMHLHMGQGLGFGFQERSKSQALEQLQSTLVNTFRKYPVKLALKRFVIPEGVKAFRGRDVQTPDKIVAFDPKSAFHRGDSRAQLMATSRRAVDDIQIQRNFMLYLQMLFYGATEGESFGRDNCRRLLRDRELVRSVWHAAVATPLNPRVAGSLKRSLEGVQSLGVMELRDRDFPAWWAAMENVVREPGDR